MKVIRQCIFVLSENYTKCFVRISCCKGEIISGEKALHLLNIRRCYTLRKTATTITDYGMV